MRSPITLGTDAIPVSEEEARHIIAGYAFGLTEDRSRRRWAYASYDCVPPAEGGLHAYDILLTAGLNSKITAASTLGLLAAREAISEALEEIDADAIFWDLPESGLTADPRDNGAEHWMWEAWRRCNKVHGVSLAVSHKLLHHKRPDVFPLIDNKTRPKLGQHYWRQVQRDLIRSADAFARLERWFVDLASDRGGVPITRLRMHDILLWCDVTGNRHDAAAAGAAL